MNRHVALAVALVCATGCSKRDAPAAPPTTPARQSSVADLLSTPQQTTTPPATLPSTPPPANLNSRTADTAAQGNPAIPPDMARHGKELARVMMLAQKRAIATGHFPAGWDELIAAKLITQPPAGKDGKPMPWKEFVKALDQLFRVILQ